MLNKEKNVPIITKLGRIDGRDGIYLESVVQEDYDITFSGDINGVLVENNILQQEWYVYKIIFTSVQLYEGIKIDECKWNIDSSFDEVVNSSKINALRFLNSSDYRHFIFATYEYIYSIIARDYTINIKGLDPWC
ncbi:hypothetical protein IC619_000225 [Hazenella sp. IB182353]|uniref:hypothetical protein n=1 Tax=Polycladospora coralii TaxID=2771432 RepID=UPI001746102A|nr:hypothetical protein [Polycladospora coralii]MBS7528918.1 hypothetical protein [Polycladospora coralii]